MTQALRAQRPVISVDTKKKELVGNYENKGRRWHPVKSAVPVNGHDFPDPRVPRAYPYGIYDIGRNRGFVNVGTDRDTGTFAVASIRGWWRQEGRRLYPKPVICLSQQTAAAAMGRAFVRGSWNCNAGLTNRG